MSELIAQAAQPAEPVALVKGFANSNNWTFQVLKNTLQPGDLLYRHPDPRIAALEADLAAAQADVREHIALCLDANKLVDEARAEAAALRVDAERYRWLREHGGKSYQETASQPAGMLPCIFMRVPSMNESGSYVLHGEYADAAIDQARKEGV